MTFLERFINRECSGSYPITIWWLPRTQSRPVHVGFVFATGSGLKRRLIRVLSGHAGLRTKVGYLVIN